MATYKTLRRATAALFILFTPTAVNASSETLSDKIDHILEETYPAGGPGAALLVYKDGKTLYRKAVGYADVENKTPNSIDQPYKLASVTKQFTALAVMKLVSEGKLDLDVDIHTYLPDFPDKGHKITLRMVLAHTAGLANYTDNDDYEAVQDQNFTIEETLQWFENDPLNFTPETEWRYSNSGYVLATHIIEKVTGKNAAEAFQSLLLTPAGMDDTRFIEADDPLTDIPKDYDTAHGPLKTVADLGVAGYGEGGLLSTVDDMLKWYKALKSNELMPAQYKETTYADNRLTSGLETSYGLGYMLGHLGGEKSIEHGGSRIGSHAYSIMVPSQDLFLIMFSNVRDEKIGMTAANIAKHILGIAGKRPKVFAASENMMKAWVSQYKHGENDIRVITYKDGSLYSRRGEHSPEYKLVPMASDQYYFADEPEVQIKFEQDGVLRIQYRNTMDNIAQRISD